MEEKEKKRDHQRHGEMEHQTCGYLLSCQDWTVCGCDLKT